MTLGAWERRLRIPVRWVDGHWECAFGGRIPVNDGANAELVIPRGSIADRTFLDEMLRSDHHKVLEEGARLLIGLTVKPEAPHLEKLKDCLIRNDDSPRKIVTGLVEPGYRYDPYFVEVQLGAPTDRQARTFGSGQGGLWLMTKGIEAVGLASTTVKLPAEVSAEPVASLNHAYTKLSEVFERWRISHTGNIYERVLYQEQNGKWYPLDVLRNNALQKVEHQTAQSLWNEFMCKMTRANRA
jgi:hypothetical protein